MSSNSEIDCSCHVDHFAVVILNGTIFSMCKHWSDRHGESRGGTNPVLGQLRHSIVQLRYNNAQIKQQTGFTMLNEYGPVSLCS